MVQKSYNIIRLILFFGYAESGTLLVTFFLRVVEREMKYADLPPMAEYHLAVLWAHKAHRDLTNSELRDVTGTNLRLTHSQLMQKNAQTGKNAHSTKVGTAKSDLALAGLLERDNIKGLSWLSTSGDKLLRSPNLKQELAQILKESKKQRDLENAAAKDDSFENFAKHWGQDIAPLSTFGLNTITYVGADFPTNL